ncbi:hypothetical protein VTN77DRAFT_6870 [Rasamsonia byssochlamydoides]|uniref:uncharacterized protein n=1 Tax=Rasamsonia byssochlamydoides TaxID=89139 RepID=UPI0037437586
MLHSWQALSPKNSQDYRPNPCQIECCRISPPLFPSQLPSLAAPLTFPEATVSTRPFSTFYVEAARDSLLSDAPPTLWSCPRPTFASPAALIRRCARHSRPGHCTAMPRLKIPLFLIYRSPPKRWPMSSFYVWVAAPFTYWRTEHPTFLSGTCGLPQRYEITVAIEPWKPS